jgi:hypothetical protein
MTRFRFDPRLTPLDADPPDSFFAVDANPVGTTPSFRSPRVPEELHSDWTSSWQIDQLKTLKRATAGPASNGGAPVCYTYRRCATLGPGSRLLELSRDVPHSVKKPGWLLRPHRIRAKGPLPDCREG